MQYICMHMRMCVMRVCLFFCAICHLKAENTPLHLKVKCAVIDKISIYTLAYACTYVCVYLHIHVRMYAMHLKLA